MGQLLALGLLVLCFIPACLSVVFASRQPLFIIWNFSWYWILGWLGEAATGSPNGRIIGLLFACMYIVRSLRTPTRTLSSFQFRTMNGANFRTDNATNQDTHGDSADRVNSGPENYRRTFTQKAPQKAPQRISDAENDLSDGAIDAEFTHKP